MHQSSSSDTANVERDELKKQLAAALDEKSRLQHERDQARRQTEEHERTVAALGRKIDTLTANLGAARMAAAEAREELDVQRQMVARLRVMYRHKSCGLAPLIEKTIAEFEAEKRKVT